MRVGHFPQHMGTNIEHNCRSISKLNPVWGGMTEQDFGTRTTYPQIQKTIGDKYRILSEDKGGHSQETPILFKKTRGVVWKITSVNVRKISSKVGEKGIGNDRWQLEVEAEQRRPGSKRFPKRKLLLIWTHWNAAIQDKDGTPNESGRWQIMDEKAGRLLEDAIHKGKAEGRTVIVGGDFNYRKKGKSASWYYAPENIFRRQRMRYVVNGLDYIAWSRDIEPKGGIRVIMHDERNPKAINRSDHPWLIGDFRWLRK